MIFELIIIVVLQTITIMLAIASIYFLVNHRNKIYLFVISLAMFAIMFNGFEYKTREKSNVRDLSTENLVKTYTEKQRSKVRIYYSEYLVNSQNGQIYEFISNEDSIRFDSCKKIQLEQMTLDSRILFYNIIEGRSDSLTHNNIKVKCIGE